MLEPKGVVLGKKHREVLRVLAMLFPDLGSKQGLFFCFFKNLLIYLAKTERAQAGEGRAQGGGLSSWNHDLGHSGAHPAHLLKGGLDTAGQHIGRNFF